MHFTANFGLRLANFIFSAALLRTSEFYFFNFLTLLFTPAVQDPRVDMTPILRRSKEAARVQRAKGTVRKNGPLGGSRPPGARGAQGRAGAHNGGAGDSWGVFCHRISTPGGVTRGRGGYTGEGQGRKRPRYEEELVCSIFHVCGVRTQPFLTLDGLYISNQSKHLKSCLNTQLCQNTAVNPLYHGLFHLARLQSIGKVSLFPPRAAEGGPSGGVTTTGGRPSHRGRHTTEGARPQDTMGAGRTGGRTTR